MQNRPGKHQKELIERSRQLFLKTFGIEPPATWLPYPFVEPLCFATEKLITSDRIAIKRQADLANAPLTLERFEMAPLGTWLAGIVNDNGLNFWHFARKDGRREIFVKLSCSDIEGVVSFAKRYDEFAEWAEERSWRMINDQGLCSGWIEWRNGQREEMAAAPQDEFRFPDEVLQKERNDRRSGTGWVSRSKFVPPDHSIYSMGYIIMSPVIPCRKAG